MTYDSAVLKYIVPSRLMGRLGWTCAIFEGVVFAIQKHAV